MYIVHHIIWLATGRSFVDIIFTEIFHLSVNKLYIFTTNIDLGNEKHQFNCILTMDDDDDSWLWK